MALTFAGFACAILLVSPAGAQGGPPAAPIDAALQEARQVLEGLSAAASRVEETVAEKIRVSDALDQAAFARLAADLQEPLAGMTQRLVAARASVSAAAVVAQAMNELAALVERLSEAVRTPTLNDPVASAQRVLVAAKELRRGISRVDSLCRQIAQARAASVQAEAGGQEHRVPAGLQGHYAAKLGSVKELAASGKLDQAQGELSELYENTEGSAQAPNLPSVSGPGAVVAKGQAGPRRAVGPSVPSPGALEPALKGLNRTGEAVAEKLGLKGVATWFARRSFPAELAEKRERLGQTTYEAAQYFSKSPIAAQARGLAAEYESIMAEPSPSERARRLEAWQAWVSAKIPEWESRWLRMKDGGPVWTTKAMDRIPATVERYRADKKALQACVLAALAAGRVPDEAVVYAHEIGFRDLPPGTRLRKQTHDGNEGLAASYPSAGQSGSGARDVSLFRTYDGRVTIRRSLDSQGRPQELMLERDSYGRPVRSVLKEAGRRVETSYSYYEGNRPKQASVVVRETGQPTRSQLVVPATTVPLDEAITGFKPMSVDAMALRAMGTAPQYQVKLDMDAVDKGAKMSALFERKAREQGLRKVGEQMGDVYTYRGVNPGQMAAILQMNGISPNPKNLRTADQVIKLMEKEGATGALVEHTGGSEGTGFMTSASLSSAVSAHFAKGAGKNGFLLRIHDPDGYLSMGAQKPFVQECEVTYAHPIPIESLEILAYDPVGTPVWVPLSRIKDGEDLFKPVMLADRA